MQLGELGELFGSLKEEVVEGTMVDSFGSRSSQQEQGRYYNSGFVVDYSGLEGEKQAEERLTGLHSPS